MMRVFAYRQEKGVVLLLVLIIVTLLSALLSEFAFSTLIDLRLAETYRDSTRAYYLARGGIRAGQAILVQDQNVYDSPDELWGIGVPDYPIADGRVGIAIVDYDGKLAINALVEGNNPQAVQKQRFTRLFDILGIGNSADLLAALIDWLDSDEEIYLRDGMMGAESDYYLTLQPSYQSRNGPMLSFDELALVRGFTSEIVEQLLPFVGLYGTTRINLNSATPEVIAAISLDPAQPLSLDAALGVVAEREHGPFTDLDDFKKRLPGQAEFLPMNQAVQYNVKFSSDYYRIRSQGWVNEGTSLAKAVFRKSTQTMLFIQVD